MEKNGDALAVLDHYRSDRTATGAETGPNIQDEASRQTAAPSGSAVPDWWSEAESRLSLDRFLESEVELDRELAACWFWFRFGEKPSFTRNLLREISRVQNALISASNA